MKTIVTIVGARPQFIKAAAVSRALAALPGVRERLVHTGQHYDPDMSDVFFEQMGIPRPDHHLGIGGLPHGAMTGRQLEAIEAVLLAERPDWVLVYGDTNSTLAGALAAAKLHIPVAHVEAGLRSGNRAMPEEINRILTDHASTLLFAPTGHAARTLASEGIAGDRVEVVGDVMYDVALFHRGHATRPGWFDSLGLRAGGFVLCTLHRAENTDDPARLAAIVAGLEKSPDPVVLPLHPRTRGKLAAADIALPEGVHATAPVGYLEMAWLEMQCRLVATDSGGVQKEAYFHGKPCVTLRDETEWVELVEHGANVLTGADAEAIGRALRDPRPFAPPPFLYGHGDAASRIAGALSAR